MIKNKHAILMAAGVLSGLLVTTGFATQEQAARGAAEGASTKASVKVQECSEEMTEVTKKRAEEAVEEARIREEQERLQAEQAAAEEARRQELLRDQDLLASLIFCEAGNQPYEGQVAVGAVVLNRVRSAAYPNSISEVIYQSGQFTPAITGCWTVYIPVEVIRRALIRRQKMRSTDPIRSETVCILAVEAMESRLEITISTRTFR